LSFKLCIQKKLVFPFPEYSCISCTVPGR
jgi:hypothetical protein